MGRGESRRTVPGAIVVIVNAGRASVGKAVPDMALRDKHNRARLGSNLLTSIETDPSFERVNNTAKRVGCRAAREPWTPSSRWGVLRTISVCWMSSVKDLSRAHFGKGCQGFVHDLSDAIGSLDRER